jgi:hypothetical protein
MWRRVHSFAFTAAVAAFLPFAVQASGTLFFTPGSGTYHVGDEIPVKVMLDSSEALGGAEGHILFDPLAWDVSVASQDDSLSWVERPTVREGSGQVDFSALISKGEDTKRRELFVLKAIGKRVGKQTFRFDSAATVSADGTGGNVLGRVDDALFDIATLNRGESSEGAVLGASTDSNILITSDVMPDQSAWYSFASSSVNVTVPLDVKRIKVGITDKPEDAGYRPLDVPSASSSATSTTLVRSIDKLDEGIWYYHATADGPDSISTHFRFAIDRTAPVFGETKIRDRSDMTDPHLVIEFSATDTVSGIESVTASWNGMAEVALTPVNGEIALLAPDAREHKLKLTATDRAGNRSGLELPVTVTSLAPPSVALNSRAREASPIKFAFKGLPGASIAVDFFGNKLERKDIVVLDAAGSGEWVLGEHLLPGSYKIAIIETTQNGAKSKEVDLDVLVEATVIGFLGRNPALTLAAFVVLIVTAFFGVRRIRKGAVVTRREETLALPAPAASRMQPTSPRTQVISPVAIARVRMQPQGLRGVELSGDVVDLRRR